MAAKRKTAAKPEKLPLYVTAITSTSGGRGRVYYYFAGPGVSRRRLPDLGGAAFDGAYRAALDKVEAAQQRLAGRPEPEREDILGTAPRDKRELPWEAHEMSASDDVRLIDLVRNRGRGLTECAALMRKTYATLAGAMDRLGLSRARARSQTDEIPHG